MNSELQKHPQEIHKDRFQVLTKLAKGLLGVLISVCYLVRTVQKALLIKIDLNLRWFYGDRPRIEKTYSSELFTTMALFSFMNHKYNKRTCAKEVVDSVGYEVLRSREEARIDDRVLCAIGCILFYKRKKTKRKKKTGLSRVPHMISI